MSDFDLKKAADEAHARLLALSPEEQQRHWDAQKASFVRGMTTPCEHGMLDFEDCEQCRNRVSKYADFDHRRRDDGDQ